MDAALIRQKIEDDGYLVLRDFFSQMDIADLERELVRARPRFPTTLNKGGLVFKEFVHFHNQALQSFVSQKKIVDFLKELIGPDFWVRKDQIVEKLPGGAEFPWHQDNGYNLLKDGYFQLWIPLTDMQPENGGLELLPGTHRDGILPHEQRGPHKTWTGTPRESVAVSVRRGDVLLFSSFILHRSGPNLTDKTRLAYVVEYMSSETMDPYIRPPYFRVARNGLPDPKFVWFYRGNLKLSNQLKYVVPRIRKKSGLIREDLKQKVKKWISRPKTDAE